MTSFTTSSAAAATRLIQFGIVGVLALFGLFYPHFQIQPEFVIPAQCWAMIALYAWSLWSWYRLTGQIFDWYIVFLTAAYAFNAGQTFLEALHLNEHGILNAEFSPEVILKTLYLVQLSLASFHWGALWAVERGAADRTGRIPDTTSPETYTSMRIVGVLLLVVAVPFAALLLKEAVGVVMSGGYFALYQQKAATGLGAGPKVLACFLVPGVMFLLAGSRESRPLRLTAVGLLLGYAATNLFLGVRHEAAVLFVALAWLWDRQIRPVKLTWLAAGGAFVLLVVFPLVAATRNTSGSERASFGYLIEEYATVKNPAVAAVHEMGGSMNTVAHTLVLVPTTRDFEYGLGYAYGVFILFPNFFWDLHPAIAREIPGAWLTRMIDPITFEQGGGMGYSFVAEAYFNVGWLGTGPVMFLMGFFAARLVRWSDASGRADRAAAIASGFCFLVFYVRAELAVVIRGVVWYACLPYLAVLFATWAQHAFYRRPFGTARPEPVTGAAFADPITPMVESV